MVIGCRDRDGASRDYIHSAMVKAGFPPASRELSQGDARWVARSGERVVVLDNIESTERYNCIRTGLKWRAEKGGSIDEVCFPMSSFAFTLFHHPRGPLHPQFEQ